MMATTPISKMPQQRQQQLMVLQQQHGKGYDQFTTLDDNVTKQILSTHGDNNFHKVDLKPHLQIIEEIVQHSTTLERTNVHDEEVSSHMENLNEKIQKVDCVGMLEALAYTVHKIASEIWCKCFGGGDAHLTTMALLKSLSKFSWEAKVVVVLAAFGVTYGEFWLVEELYQTHPLAKSIVLVKQLPDIFEQLEKLRPRLEALWSLIKAMLNVTKCIVQFHELPPQYISPNQPPMLEATIHIPTAVYWTIRSVIACVSDVIGLIGLDHKSIPLTIEAGELSRLAHKVNDIHEYLTKQLTLCNQYVDEKKQIEAYNSLVQLFETTHFGNMNILKALIPASKDDLGPLVYGPTRRRVGIEELQNIWTFLLISDLYISREEFKIFNQIRFKIGIEDMYLIGIEHYGEVVWIPVVDKSIPWTETMQRDYERLQATMQGCSVHQPSLINPGVIKYFKEMWHFNKKPILVVLNAMGQVVNTNALHMLWIWGTLANSFSSEWEKELWSSETWRLEFLVDGIDENVLQWAKNKDQFICLYGGDDIDWIRKFTMKARAVAQEVGILFKMMYAGKRNPKDRVMRNIDIITEEKLSYCWEDLTNIWFFWNRIESMWYSKMKHGINIENDHIMQEIKTMLIFDGNEQGWALISKGSKIMAKANGELFLKCFEEYDKWKENIDGKGFAQALNDHLKQLHTSDHCNHLILPETDGMIPDMVLCTECGRPMKKSISVIYNCCNN